MPNQVELIVLRQKAVSVGNALAVAAYQSPGATVRSGGQNSAH
jgi:hypothetical protein